MDMHISVSTGVEGAVRDGLAVVALESTVIAHGLPYPANLEVALALEAIIRDAGAVPATVAVLGGEIRVGLSQAEIEFLATGTDIRKLGTSDLPAAMSSGWNGATTVSATSFAAARAGITVFVTGGIGGVHRDAEETFDISSDLWELARTSIMVVCAGAKAILDLPATLEWLETHQVPVFGYRTDEFPAFYSGRSGLNVERLDGPHAAARVFAAKQRLGLPGGVLVAVPPPHDAEYDASQSISQALAEAKEGGIRGKDVTPWLLARVAELSGGRSVEANVALLKNNAAVGAEIAKAIARR